MEKLLLKAILFSFTTLTFFSLTSCQDLKQIKPAFLVVAGNYNYRQGKYEKATIDYINAKKENASKSVVSYNLGNVYNALGEPYAALKEWEKVDDPRNKALMVYVAFNKGLTYYNLGEYSKAALYFRNALEIDPNQIEAKINLELALSRLQRGVAPPHPESLSSPKLQDNTTKILQYVQNKEIQAWQNSVETPVADGQDDW